MRRIKTLALSLPIALAFLLPPEAADARNRKDRVAIGIGVGLIGGAIASQGRPGAMIGGAVAGAAIGHAISREKERREWRRESRRYYERRHRQ